MRHLVLLVSILGLLVAGRTANAAIVATFEGPASGPLAGIGIIRGWAFDNSGGNINNVEVYIDDVYVSDAPCCSGRGDVANVFGPQALKSGWGLTFNWGNLPAGLHTIHVIVRSPGAVWTSDKRQIDVVKPGGFAFLSDYDLSEATVRIDHTTEEIILDNVYVVDKATGQRTQVNGIRYRWLPEIQNPQIVGPWANSVTLVIEFNQKPYGAITRWVKFPILVWAAPGFSRADLERAISLWEDAIGSAGLDFQITDDQSRANIVFEFGPAPAGACGEEGPTRITDHVIEAGHGTYSAASQCTGPGSAAATALAHGLGHILGFAGHTPSNTDIMSAPLVPFQMSSELAEAMRFIYSVPPGTVIR